MTLGKGELQTYWLHDKRSAKSETQSSFHSESEAAFDLEILEMFDPKTSRLIDWNVDVLLRLLRQIAATRQESRISQSREQLHEDRYKQPGKAVIDEVKEIITLPELDVKALLKQKDPESLEIPKLWKEFSR